MTTNQLRGNPHFEEADHDNGSENFNLAQAVLAVAFELRTANMIAALQPSKDSSGSTWGPDKESTLFVRDLINKRMSA